MVLVPAGRQLGEGTSQPFPGAGPPFPWLSLAIETQTEFRIIARTSTHVVNVRQTQDATLTLSRRLRMNFIGNNHSLVYF
jgi:hypothetical protein